MSSKIKADNNQTLSYCAFLRGVNVKGTNMKMADVCAVFSKAGMSNVSSILASGNIIFSSDKNPELLKTMLEKAMSTHFDYEAFLFLKDKSSILEILAQNPFTPNSEMHIYGFVGVEGVEQILMDEFNTSKKLEGEAASIVGNNFYWNVPKGNTLESEFGKILGRKNLKDAFTSRNLNTIEKIRNKL
jgi:uncharacterized protein (DUF1697 family)